MTYRIYKNKNPHQYCTAMWDRLYRRKGKGIVSEIGEQRSVPPVRPTVRKFVKTICDEYKLFIKKGPILEVGCGCGNNVLGLSAQYKYECFGLDTSSVAIQQATNASQLFNVSANWLVGNSRKLPYRKASFRMVLSIKTFQFNNWASAFDCWAEVSRVLVRNGLFLLVVRSTSRDIPANSSMIIDRGITFLSKVPYEKNMIYHHYSLEEIAYLCNANNMRVVFSEEIKKDRVDELDGRRGWWQCLIRKK